MIEAESGGDLPVDGCPWLVRSGYFRRVVGFDQAAELLTDDRLDADLVGLFEGLGVTSGPLWDIMKASFLSINGAQHKRLRALVAGRFTPRAVEAVRPFAKEAATRLARELSSRGGGELVADFASPYVVTGTCGLIGFPPEDVAGLSEALDLISSGTKDLEHRLDQCTTGVLALVAYGREVLSLRSQQPTDDVLSLVAALVADGTYSEDQALALIAGLLSAGVEPTINQLGLMVLVLADHHDTWDALASDELAIPRVVEELLRYRSTNQGVNRLVTEPVDYQGQRFRPGEQVLIGIHAANHDPNRFPRADRFDPAANTRPHMAFGFGPHHCLGAALARLQLQEGIAALTKAMTCPTIIEAEIEQSTGLVGPSHLRLSCAPR